nr:MAG TPA: hypothetical protein [Caudoviricetes sp.]
MRPKSSAANWHSLAPMAPSCGGFFFSLQAETRIAPL